MPRHPAAFALLALCLVAALAPHAAVALTFPDAVQSLIPKLAGPNPPGEVLFKEDFSSGKLDAWKPDQGWSLVDRPDGPGKCAQVIASEKVNENLILKQHIKIVPGHPVVVAYKTRFVSGGDPLYLRVDFFDETGVTGKPYARQDTSHEGPQWLDNAIMISDWFPAYTREITIWFHHNPNAKTTSLLSDVRVMDLYQPATQLVAAEITRYEALSAKLSRDAAALSHTPVADAWRALITRRADRLQADLAAAAKLPPGTPEAEAALARPATYLARFSDALAGLEAGTVTTKGVLVYATPPVTGQMVLPYGAQLPPAQKGLSLTACPGETEPASLVLWAPDRIPSLLPSVTDLRGPGGTIPASAVDIKWVKCWYQAGSAPHGVAQDRAHKVLVPELLLNDDTLVKVDLEAQHNSLKLAFPDGPRYVPIDDPTPPKPTWGFAYKLADFPVRDAATLQPADLEAGQNKQIWITVKIPPNTKAGKYSGKVRLASLGDIPFTVEVLPFTLPAPKTHYDPTQDYTGSLYYWGELDKSGAGGIGYKYKSEQQFRAELKIMFDHGVVAPAMVWSPDIIYRDEPFFRRHLQMAKDAGMSGRPLYFADSGLIGAPTAPAALHALKENVTRTLRIASEYGFTDVYFYGMDEATGDTLKSERAAWPVVQAAGGKVIVSGFNGQLEAVGDLLDLFNRAGEPAADNAAEWHKRGHKIWNYANPQTPIEDPEVYRRNYGLYLWRLDYDGACTYCFMDSSGTQWNDFDDDTYRDHCLAYPTVNGVIGTVAIEGLREGFQDVQYATALRQAIAAAQQGASPARKAKGEEAAKWLDGLDMRTVNLDEARTGMIRYIAALR